MVFRKSIYGFQNENSFSDYSACNLNQYRACSRSRVEYHSGQIKNSVTLLLVTLDRVKPIKLIGLGASDANALHSLLFASG